MPQRKRLPRKTRDQWITERKDEIGLSWEELERAASMTKKTMLNIREGGNSYPRTIRNLEAVLGWKIGKGISEIDAGREPQIAPDPLATPTVTPVNPPRLYKDPLSGQPAYGQLLRDILRQMGPAAFWREIGLIESEQETTFSSGASAP